MSRFLKFNGGFASVLVIFRLGFQPASAGDWKSWFSGGVGKEKATREYSKRIPRDGAETMKLKVGPGFLEIRGGGPGDEIQIEALITARAPDPQKAEELLDRIEILDGRRGSRLTLETRGPENLKRARYQVNLTLRVPADLALEIIDGSGDIEIFDVQGGLEIQDGSGEIHLENIGGGARIDDGSGDLEIRTLSGPLRIHDGSGNIQILDLDATGDPSDKDQIRISDGSGDIQIREVLGNLTIEDGSGSVRITDLAGSLDLTDGSGNIDIQEITGTLEVEDGSGNVKIREVVGDVGISDGSGDIDLDRIAGELRIHSDGSGNLHIGEVSGSIEKP